LYFIMKKIPKIITLIESSRGYGRSLLRGISQYARLYGPWNFYAGQPFYYTDRYSESVIDIINKWGADGIIMRETKDIPKIVEMNIPAIIITYTREKFPGLISLVGDSSNSGRMAAEHLLERGFKHFGYCGIANRYWSVERGLSFQKKVNDIGFEVNIYESPSPESKFTWGNDQKRLSEWLRKLPKPVGILACTDDRGQNVIEACRTCELKVPEEVAVIGVDNDSLLCELTNPPLSSVSLDAFGAGCRAAELLHKLIEKECVDTDQIICAEAIEVAARQSTDTFAIDDADMILALRFIQDNARKGIQVKDVVKATSIQKRTLQKKFRMFLQRSIGDKIDQVRIELICKFLLESSKSISQIADELDFVSEGHIARYFKRVKKMTPLQYRKKKGSF
jgi:LacI family transcriptional regulator